MQIIYKRIGLLCLLVLATPLTAQKFSIKPVIGYYYPRLAEVNSKIKVDVDGLRNILGAPIPSAGKFTGNIYFGGQIEYQANEEYFFNLNVSYYREKVAADYNSANTVPPWQLSYEREIRMVDVILNMHYYLNYSSWKRFNKYIGIGVGMMFVHARSLTFIASPDIPLDSRGEYSGNTLTGILAIGGNYRLSKTVKLWSEFGLEYGNVGELNGKVTSLEQPEETDAATQSSFDLTGLFLRGGLGITLPF